MHPMASGHAETGIMMLTRAAPHAATARGSKRKSRILARAGRGTSEVSG